MENPLYIFIAVLLVVISVLSVIFCCFRGKGASHKMLVFFASLFGAAALVCFGGNAVLALFGMGWRCAPFNTMLFFCAVLFVPTLCYCFHVLGSLENTNPALRWCGFVSMSLVLLMIPMFLLLYFGFSSWSDGLTTYNGQTIVYETNGHGSFGAWHYYTHINDLVHGVEITQDGWYLAPPRPFLNS